jgi:hypothetical protein
MYNKIFITLFKSDGKQLLLLGSSLLALSTEGRGQAAGGTLQAAHGFSSVGLLLAATRAGGSRAALTGLDGAAANNVRVDSARYAVFKLQVQFRNLVHIVH